MRFRVSPRRSHPVQKLNYVSAENDPEGSVSIFKRTTKDNTYATACEVGFEKFNTADRTNRLVDGGMRVGGMNFTTLSMVSCLSRFGERIISSTNPSRLRRENSPRSMETPFLSRTKRSQDRRVSSSLEQICEGTPCKGDVRPWIPCCLPPRPCLYQNPRPKV